MAIRFDLGLMRYGSVPGLAAVAAVFAALSLGQTSATIKPKAPASPALEIPDEFRTKVNIAGQLARANQPAEALKAYTEILTASPNLFTIAFERGKLYQQTNDHAKAIADFTTAINFRPMEYYEAYFRRCMSYYHSGDQATAVADCSK